ncbi:MAG: class I SAM-dependent methyltransferase [Leptolyngbyaceae cyanobacterium]
MNESIAHQVFFELHSNLPREGPGDNDSTSKAFSLLPGLPSQPRILDLGCGPGMQTVQLAKLTDGPITAVDLHQPYLDQLAQSLTAEGLRERVTLLQGDMQDLPFSPNSFDVIWAEGSAYVMEFGSALRGWRSLLNPEGYLVASEISWLRSDPPTVLTEFWTQEYPNMQSVEANLTLIKTLGYLPIAHFLLPAKAWWESYYTPIEHRLDQLQPQYADNTDALQVIELHRQEIDLFRRYSNYYGYAFYIAQVDPTASGL